PGRQRDGGSADYGCAYILDGDDASVASPSFCGMPCRAGSDYCAAHHALCHLRPGSRAETMKEFAQEALADAVGGKQARRLPAPPASWFPRVEKAARPFFYHKRSRYVQEQATMQPTKRKPVRDTAGDPIAEAGPTLERQRHGPV